MKVRITYRTECIIEAESLAEAKVIWNTTDVVPKDTENAKFGYIDTVSVETDENKEACYGRHS